MDDSFWQDFQSWEKQASEAWSTYIRSPEFIDLMNRQVESWLLLKQHTDRVAEDALKKTLLPSRVEQERLAFLIHKIGNQVDVLSERIVSLSRKIDQSR